MAEVLPGAEPFSRAGGAVGVLLCHGFTGSPQSLRPWAEYLADQGLAVSVPLLPGHGTSWQDMARTTSADWYAEAEAAPAVRALDGPFAGRLPRAAARRTPRARRQRPGAGQSVAGPDTRLFLLAPVLKYIVPSLPGVGSISRSRAWRSFPTSRFPSGAATLPRIWRETARHLAAVLVFRSSVDHVAPA